MYIPSRFRQDNIEQLLALIRAYPFATLTVNTPEGIEAMHLPLVLHEQTEGWRLQGHIAKANPLWQRVASGTPVMVIFQGPNGYISPNHYPTKAEHGRAVPTWNYVVVQVRGTIGFTLESSWLYRQINQLTDEQEVRSAQPWSVADAPSEYIEKMLAAIVGVEIDVSSMSGQWKLSQNQPEANRQGVVQGLRSQTDLMSELLADWVSNATQHR